ncbi:MAG: hypothetical protein LBG60_01920 [Bifidobacteriaceae bacterium]|jgi:hypothetical protein|nr:hypothetical protein [Bifidobacteriaceae bacterium]
MKPSLKLSKLPGKRVLVIAAAIVAILAGGFTAYELNETTETIRTEADDLGRQIANTKGELGDLLEVSNQALADHEDKTIDPDTYTALAEAVRTAEAAMALAAPEPAGSDWLLQARDRRDQTVEVLRAVQDALLALRIAEIEEYNSNQVWLLAEMKAKLAEAIESGEKTYAESEGQVDDESSREALRKVLDDAIAARDEPLPDVPGVNLPSASPSPSATPSSSPSAAR